MECHARRQLGESWNARVSYIGYIGQNSFRLGMDTDQNSIRASAKPYDPLSVPYPQAVRLFGNWGVANYQDLEIQVSHRMASGFYLQGTFDWAKDLTNAGGDAPTAFNVEQGSIGPPGVALTGINDRFNLR